MYFLYLIESRLTGAIYIGKTNNPNHRWAMHKTIAKNDDASKTYYKSKSAVHHAIKKYGVDNFDFQVISCYSSEEECYLEEQFWIQYLLDANIKLYNVSDGGVGATSGEKHPNFGKPRTEDVKTKISDKLKGRFVGPNNPNYGNKMPSDSRKRISDFRKNFVVSEETKNKISNTLLSMSDEERNIQIGENQHNSKLKEYEVVEIKKMLNIGIGITKIALKFNVHKNTISNIKRGVNWKHIKV